MTENKPVSVEVEVGATFSLTSKKRLVELMTVLCEVETTHGEEREAQQERVVYDDEEKAFCYFYSQSHSWPLDKTFLGHLVRLKALFDEFGAIDVREISLSTGRLLEAEMSLADALINPEKVFDLLKVGIRLTLQGAEDDKKEKPVVEGEQGILINGQPITEKQFEGLNMLVESTGLTKYIKKVFRIRNVFRIGGILERTEDELLLFPGFSPNSLKQINRTLAPYDLKLGDKVEGFHPKD